MSSVHKAVIPVAGLGTRFLPVTKSVPKELLPIVTTPTLHLVIGEAIASGVEEVVLVSSPTKVNIADYFRSDTIYDHELAEMNKESLLEDLRSLAKKISIKIAIQDRLLGLGHAVLCAKKAIGDEPFLVILPDVLIESKTPCCKQLIAAFEKTGVAVNITEHSPRHKLHLYGIHDIASSDGRYHRVRGVVEKPRTEDAPSDLSVGGRYLFPSDLFEILERTPPGRNGEIQLADAMDTLAKEGRMIAYEYEGRQFDTGEPEGYLKANIFYGYRKYPEQIGAFMREMLNRTAQNNQIDE